jgi:histidine ammonia-lyase
MDGLKSAVAGIADLLDRQLVLLCCPQTSDGLPENLIGLRGEERVAHHGFKAMQITCSALTAEALKLTMPAASFSRSTESHNQDKVSMGTIAARDCLKVLELTEHCAAIGMLGACQALDLRDQQANGDPEQRTRGRSQELLDAVRVVVPFLAEDRRQDLDIAQLLSLYRGQPDFAGPGTPRGEGAAG